MCSQFNMSVSCMKSFYSFAKNMKYDMHIWGSQMTCQDFTVKYRESGNSTHDSVTQKPTLRLGLASWTIFVKN